MEGFLIHTRQEVGGWIRRLGTQLEVGKMQVEKVANTGDRAVEN